MMIASIVIGINHRTRAKKNEKLFQKNEMLRLDILRVYRMICGATASGLRVSSDWLVDNIGELNKIRVEKAISALLLDREIRMVCMTPERPPTYCSTFVNDDD